jgi:hypothetical protein
MYKIVLCVSNTFYSALMCVTVSAGPKEGPQTLGPAKLAFHANCAARLCTTSRNATMHIKVKEAEQA